MATIDRVLRSVLLGGLLVCGGMSIHAQDAAEESSQLTDEQFDEQSMAYRKALYYDPSLEAPLKKLIDLYRSRNEVDVLTGIYQSHIVSYPQDPSGRAVLVRLLIELNKPEAGTYARNAADAFPDDALIHYLHYRWLESTKDPRALEVLSKAVSLETRPARKEKWIDELIEHAALEDRSDLSKKHLLELAGLPGQTPETLLALARKMQKGKFHDLVLTTLTKAEALNPSPELRVDIALLAASAEAAKGEHEKAGDRLDALLGKVAPDYWRRTELVSRRVNLLKTDAQREAMLKKARAEFESNPESEAAALDYAELLVACELRRDALKVLRDAAEKGRRSERIEDALLKLFERLNDLHGARAYLKTRVEESPERTDLAYRYIKTLYVTGGQEEAAKLLETVLENLSEEERMNQLLDLARYLRRMSQPAEAAELFKRIVDMRPDRLDVRRELAESYLAVGKRQAARELFTADLAKDAEIENFLDVVQFMIQQEILPEARKALETRMEEDSSFDVRILLVDVLGKLGDQVAGIKMVAGTREMADTDARYSRWLEAGAQFHELFDTVEIFFEREQSKLLDGSDLETWTEKRIARFVTFCEVAGRNDGRDAIVALLKERVDDENLPEELRLRLRRMLVALLERDPNEVQELQAQLSILADEDSARQPEYRLLTARMHHTAKEGHLAAPLLSDIDYSMISDARLLAGLHTILIEYGYMEQALQALERSTQLEPTNRANWSAWISALAATGEESRLRTALRRLLAGVDRMVITAETYELLRAHLVDSYWRTAARILSENDDERLGEVFPLLDAIERSKQLDDDGLWVLWTRAYVLNRQGRDAARDEAAENLVRYAENLQAAKARAASAETGETPDSKNEEEKEAGEVRIHFPDGLAVSLESALSFLKDGPSMNAGAILPGAVSSGPMPPMRLSWVFEGTGADIHEIVPLTGEKAVLISDVGGMIHKLDIQSGKLLWTFNPSSLRREQPNSQGAAVPPGRSNYNWSNSFTQTLMMAPVVAADGLLFVSVGSDVAAVSTKDASLQWRSTFDWGNVKATRVRLPVKLIPSGGRLLAYDTSRALAGAFDMKTGKLLWTREVLPEDSRDYRSRAMYLTDFSSGASADGRYFLVYGLHAQVLDSATGNLIWSFEPSQTRKFPVELTSPDAATAAPLASAVSLPGMNRYAGRPSPVSHGANLNHLSTRQERLGRAGMFITQEGKLAAPAVNWSESLLGGINAAGYVRGERMILVGSNLVSVYSLNLPLGAKQYYAGGTVVGFSGNKLCLLNGMTLQILDLTRGKMRSVPLNEVAGSSGRVDAVIDGARIYVTGEAGVLCVNAHTQRKIFFEPWPQRLLDVRGKAETESVTGYYLQGIVPAEKQARSSGLVTSSRYSSSRSRARVTNRCLSFRAAASDGVLMTAVRPDMVAAFVNSTPAPDDGDEEKV